MARIAGILVLLVAAGVFLQLPRPDPTRLAAASAGSLLREPAHLPPDADWRAGLGVGDRVETADGRRGRVRAVRPAVEGAGGGQARVELELASGDVLEVAPDELAELVEGRPLWRYLVEGSAAERRPDGVVVLRVRGYRMSLPANYHDHRQHARLYESLQRGLRSIAREEGFEIRFQERAKTDFPGVLLQADFVSDGIALEVQLPDGTLVASRKPWYAPDLRALFPPLLAILLAVLLRRPLVALASGVVAGAVLDRLAGGAGAFAGTGEGALRVLTHYLPEQLGATVHLEIVVFVLCTLVMVGVVTRAGGIQGLVEHLSRFAKGARGSQIATFLMGLAVLFDHYANTILVGTTMRPLCDRFRVSREKLAYLVDSTAAPVAGISIFSTWIAFEVSTFSVHLPEAGMSALEGYDVFLRTMPFRFYSLFTLWIVALVVTTGRDFGPMLRAERRARGGALLREGARPLLGASASELEPSPRVGPRARLVLLPLAVFVGVTVGTALVRGNGSFPLMVGALAGLATALALTLFDGRGREAVEGAWASARATGFALAILVASWMLGAVCRDLGTATYLSMLVQESLNPLLLPIVLFLLAGVISFATGSAWATMTILLPLVVSVAFEAGQSAPTGGEGMLVVAIAAVLEGAIFGDHCSPVSDTTVMASIAAASDHVDHVRTQAPYAALASVAALLCGYYPAVILNLDPVWSLAAGAVLTTVFLFVYGRRVEARVAAEGEVLPEPAAAGSAPSRRAG